MGEPDPRTTEPTPTPRVLAIDAGATGLAFVVDDEGILHQLAFGAEVAGVAPAFPPVLYPLAYPTFGEEPLREPALRVTHADGATSTRLVVTGATVVTVGDEIEHLRIVLRDRVAPLEVVLAFRAHRPEGVLAQWVEVTNLADAPIVLHDVASTSPAIPAGDAWLRHWGGGWAGEWSETAERLVHGTKVLRSAGGVRPSLYLPPVVVVEPDGRAAEEEGRAATCTLAWGGDTRISAEVALHGQARVIVGIETRGAERTLEPGETFVTPEAIWSHSDHGVGPSSRALHRYARAHVVRDGFGLRARVANTWEAIGFRLDPEGLDAQIDAAADLGAELFLLDDGWFGVSHPRDDDTVGLGDWSVDRRKLPEGLQPIIDRTLAAGMRFGLWVEPEMVNPDSTLAAEHPDWVIAEPGRVRRLERHQLVLDLCRPEVAAFCVATIDRVLAEHPGISYLKWDANRDITEPGSGALALDRQTHLPVDRVRATATVMAEVARRHPDVELMLCASGGGRSDLGTLAHFHELWTSDNTDPVDRVRIQWGASHLLPASVLGAHVTRWGNRPFAFACAVALSGRFGFDVDLTALSPEELAIARQAVAADDRLRHLVQQGELHRLVSPVGSTVGALAFVDPSGAEAALFAFSLPGDGSSDAPPATVPVPIDALVGAVWQIEDLTPGRAADGRVTVERSALAEAIAWPVGDAPCAAVRLLSAAR